MMKMLRSSSESGQIIVVVATALFMVMLGAAVVAVDMGNGFLNKQRLQNTADSAALAAAYRIAAGGTHADAVNAARSIVTQNTGGTVSLPDLGEVSPGTDPGISNGIQTSGSDVRVALTKGDVRTFFSGVFGRNTLTVNSKSRAKVNAGGGLLPIAVKRYSAGNTLYQLGDHGNPSQVTDYMAKAGTTIQNNWGPEWPALLTGHASPIATVNDPGPSIPILGHDAVANEAQGNDFHFWVAPDVRNITWSYPPGPTYTNGVTADMSIQNLKNLEMQYFSPTRPGYTSVEGMPHVGDQIAILSGVDTSNTVAEMAKYYGPTTKFVAMVYDGTVHRKPEFQLEVNPIFSQSNATPRPELAYNVNLHQTNGAYPYYGTGIGLSVVGLDSSFANWSFDPPGTVDVVGVDVSRTLKITAAHPNPPSPSDTEPQTTGVRSFLIKASDPLNHIQRTATAAVLFGNDPSLVATCNSAYVQVEQGSSGRFTVDLRGYNGFPDTYVRAGSPEWEGTAPYISAGYVSNNPGNVPSTVQLVRDSHTTTFSLYFDVLPSASVGEYVMKLPLKNLSTGVIQYIYLSLEIVPNSSGTTVGNTASFVYILGFASFEVTNYSNNTAWGKVISDLVDDPTKLTAGSAVRLIGWNQ